MSAHSPTPWEMRTAANGDVGIKAAGYDGVIAEFFAELHRLGEQRPAEAQANARLFLATPDLLAACEALRQALAALLEDEDVQNTPTMPLLAADEAIRAGDAALAKARGGK